MSINGSEDSIEEEDEEEEEEQPETKRRGPGRKRRTAPVLVETEEGEIKHVSPSEYRRLRRCALAAVTITRLTHVLMMS